MRDPFYSIYREERFIERSGLAVKYDPIVVVVAGPYGLSKAREHE